MNRIILFLVSILLFSCSINKHEKSLIGNWYALHELEAFKIEFIKDSIIIYDRFVYVSLLKADKSYLQFKNNSLLQDSIKNIKLFYTLNQNKDSLTTFIENDPNSKTEFLKADNYLDFLFKKNKVRIELKSNDSAEATYYSGRKSINIFIYKKDDLTIIETEFSQNLDSLNKDIEIIASRNSDDFDSYYEFCKIDMEIIHPDIPPTEEDKDYYYKPWFKKYFQFQIFADKFVVQTEIDEIVNTLKKNYDLRIYQIYQTPENYYSRMDLFNGIKK